MNRSGATAPTMATRRSTWHQLEGLRTLAPPCFSTLRLEMPPNNLQPNNHCCCSRCVHIVVLMLLQKEPRYVTPGSDHCSPKIHPRLSTPNVSKKHPAPQDRCLQKEAGTQSQDAQHEPGLSVHPHACQHPSYPRMVTTGPEFEVLNGQRRCSVYLVLLTSAT